MRCPICKREIPNEGNPYRPFCSERCKLIDLDNWLEGRYRIPGSTRSPEKNERDEKNGDDDSGDGD